MPRILPSVPHLFLTGNTCEHMLTHGLKQAAEYVYLWHVQSNLQFSSFPTNTVAGTDSPKPQSQWLSWPSFPRSNCQHTLVGHHEQPRLRIYRFEVEIVVVADE